MAETESVNRSGADSDSDPDADAEYEPRCCFSVERAGNTRDGTHPDAHAHPNADTDADTV